MPKQLVLDPRVRKLLSKGLNHHQAGRLRPAEVCYRRTLRIDPRCPQALHLMGLLAQQAGNYEQSIRLIGKALAFNPDDADTLKSLAESFLGAGRIEWAIPYLDRVADLLPNSVEARHRLGKAQEKAGDWEAAKATYLRALALQPGAVDVLGSLAGLQYQQGAYAEAVESCRRALSVDPINYEIYTQLGNAQTDLGNFPAAVEAYRSALTLKPDSARAVYGLGYFFERKGEHASALEAYRNVLNLDPRFAQAYFNLAIIHHLHGDLPKAMESLEQLRKLDPDSADARSLLGLIHLQQGNFRAGWAEYEARWETPYGIRFRRRLSQPLWQGQPLNGARILLYAEQGLGDTLQFIRYVPQVAERGGEVILEVQPRLQRLLEPLLGDAKVISKGDELPEFAWQCPLLSLPLAFSTDLETIPAPIPYIRPDPALAEAWRARFTGQALRIGLAWAGSPLHPNEQWRAIPLSTLAPLTRIERADFYSLQMGPPACQVKQMSPPLDLGDLCDQQKDMADTAAIIANLDLVISVDTSVAHLAGAMGKPVWVLLSKSPDWRWLLGREDSPWYPTARLFRQSALGNWHDVVAKVEHELRDLAAKHAARQNGGDRHE